MINLADPVATADLARRLLNDLAALSRLFPGLDPAGLLNLAHLIAALPSPPRPDGIQGTDSPPGEPERVKGTSYDPADGNPSIDTYKLALIETMGTKSWAIGDILGMPTLLAPPAGQDDREWLKGTLTREPRFFAAKQGQRGTRYTVTDEGRAWAHRSRNRMVGKPEDAPVPARPRGRAPLMSIIAGTMGIEWWTAEEVAKNLQGRGLLPTKVNPDKPGPYIEAILGRQKPVFEAKEDRKRGTVYRVKEPKKYEGVLG